MRCFYCGWDNKTNAVSCEKCRQPMSDAMPNATQSKEMNKTADFTSRPTALFTNRKNDPESRPTEIFTEKKNDSGSRPTVVFTEKKNDNVSRATAIYEERGNNSGPRPTLRIDNIPAVPAQVQSSRVTVMYAEEANHSEMASMDIPSLGECPHCNYPSDESQIICPNCGQSKRVTVMPKRRANAEKQEAVQLEPACSLTLIPEVDEQIIEVKNEYKGTSITLNRDNTEPGNYTITSREQAKITFEEGKWYIEDKSEMNTTFIRVREKTEIKPGDVIMLGDRLFEFE